MMHGNQGSNQQSNVRTLKDIDKEINELYKRPGKPPVGEVIIFLLIFWLTSLVILAFLSVTISVNITDWGTPALLTCSMYLIWSMRVSSKVGENRSKIKLLKEEKRGVIERERKEEEDLKRRFESEQKEKGLIKYKDQWGTPSQVERWKEIDTGLSNNFAGLSPHEFEKFIAELFRKMGYNAQVTGKPGDFGADIIARKGNETILIQVKKYAMGNNVTPEEVQRTLGAMWKHKADKAVFVTTSGFTVRAKEVEREAPIELWDKSILHQMVRKYLIGDTN